MPLSEATPLDRVAERSARWLSGRTSRRSLLGRVGDRLLTLVPPGPAAPAEPAAPKPATAGAAATTPTTPAPATDVVTETAANPMTATTARASDAVAEPAPHLTSEPAATRPSSEPSPSSSEPAAVMPAPAPDAEPQTMAAMAAPASEAGAQPAVPAVPKVAAQPAVPVGPTSEPAADSAAAAQPAAPGAPKAAVQPAAPVAPTSMPATDSTAAAEPARPAAAATASEPATATATATDSQPATAAAEPAATTNAPEPAIAAGAAKPADATASEPAAAAAAAPTKPAATATASEPAPPAVATALAVSRVRFHAADAVVLARADAFVLAVAAPVAAALDAPLLAVDDDRDAIAAEVRRLGQPARYALDLDYPDAERIGTDADDLAALSAAAADFVRARTGAVRAFAIAQTDEGRRVAGLVAACAAVRRFPVMIGADAARQGATQGERRAAVTYLVGADAIAAGKEVPGGFPLPAPGIEATADRLAQLLRADRALDGVHAVGLVAPDTDPAVVAALAGCGGPVVFRLPDPAPAQVFSPAGGR